jgi:hypothetical protein
MFAEKFTPVEIWAHMTESDLTSLKARRRRTFKGTAPVRIIGFMVCRKRTPKLRELLRVELRNKLLLPSTIA